MTWVKYVNLSLAVIGLGVLMMFGFAVSSSQYLSAIGSGSLLGSVVSAAGAFITWTPTNLLLVSLLSCFLCAATVSRRDGIPIDLGECWVSGSLKAVPTYLAVLGGASYLEFNRVFFASQEDYTKLFAAVVVSGLALTATPEGMLQRVMSYRGGRQR